MRIGWSTGCDYEWTQHWFLAREFYGCQHDELLALRDWRAADCFDSGDRAVLAATDELLKTGALSDDTWQRCEASLGRATCLDLVAAIGTWSMISKLAQGLKIPLEENVASWPPDGQPGGRMEN